MIQYLLSVHGITEAQLEGFFVGWPNPPAPEAHPRLLQGSSYVVLAKDETTGKVVGYITAISDGVLTAFVPQLEVLPAYQKRGIGSELVRRMTVQLEHLYAIDLLCDPQLQGFYARFGMRPAAGMLLRHYGNQSGADVPSPRSATEL